MQQKMTQEVYGYFDLRCPKCRHKVSYSGKMSSFPPCPKCGTATDTKEFNEIQRFALFLGRIDKWKKDGKPADGRKQIRKDFPEYNFEIDRPTKPCEIYVSEHDSNGNA